LSQNPGISNRGAKNTKENKKHKKNPHARADSQVPIRVGRRGASDGSAAMEGAT
jgi:hypothetical protein